MKQKNKVSPRMNNLICYHYEHQKDKCFVFNYSQRRKISPNLIIRAKSFIDWGPVTRWPIRNLGPPKYFRTPLGTLKDMRHMGSLWTLNRQRESRWDRICTKNMKLKTIKTGLWTDFDRSAQHKGTPKVLHALSADTRRGCISLMLAEL